MVEAYKPHTKWVRDLGQYSLAREFVPGEPLASSAHCRHFPVVKVAAGLPAVTAEVGDRRGFHIGETAGLAARAVCFDPWYLPEVMEASSVVPILGVQGLRQVRPDGDAVLQGRPVRARVGWRWTQPGGCTASWRCRSWRRSRTRSTSSAANPGRCPRMPRCRSRTMR